MNSSFGGQNTTYIDDDNNRVTGRGLRDTVRRRGGRGGGGGNRTLGNRRRRRDRWKTGGGDGLVRPNDDDENTSEIIIWRIISDTGCEKTRVSLRYRLLFFLSNPITQLRSWPPSVKQWARARNNDIECFRFSFRLNTFFFFYVRRRLKTDFTTCKIRSSSVDNILNGRPFFFTLKLLFLYSAHIFHGPLPARLGHAVRFENRRRDATNIRPNDGAHRRVRGERPRVQVCPLHRFTFFQNISNWQWNYNGRTDVGQIQIRA